MAQLSSLRSGRSRKFKAEINVVPYIDVMLVLLIIFMAVAPMTNPSVINLPSAGKTTQPPTDYIEISLKADHSSEIGIHGKKSVKTKNEQDLIQQLRVLHQDHPELPVMIAADKDIKYEEVVNTIGEASKLGIPRVGLATK